MTMKTATNARSRTARKAAVAGLIMGLSLSLVGCSDVANLIPKPPVSEAPPTNTVTGSGTQIKTASGSYQKLSLHPQAPVYTYDEANSSHLLEAGWSHKDGASGKRFVIDYVLKEYLDSTALEGGDASYQKWYATDAKKYFAGDVYRDIKNGQGNVVVGNFGGKLVLPGLINDGGTRAKNVDITVSGYLDYTGQPGVKAIEYSVQYSADYRVSDASAAKFVSDYSKKHLSPEKHLTPEQFLATDMAKPQLKDGKGENSLHLSGSVSIFLGKDAKGAWTILGFWPNPNFNTDDFTQNDEEYFKTS